MNRHSRSEPLRRFWRLALAAVFLLFTLGAARGVNLIQEFYLPMPEAQVLQGMETVSPAITDTNFFMVTSLLTTGDGTVIYYDQWEDGYETNLTSPTQASTQVWGDGNDANGVCPGFTHDPVGIPAGTVITLSNTVPCKPRNPGQLFYDGGDRIAANKALVVNRAGWPSPTGPVDGGAVVVLSTLDYGTNFVSPIGQDMAENLFKYVGFFVMASEDNTTVTIDLDGPAGPTPPTTMTLNQGQSYFVNGGVKRGATVTANKPIEANLACGDTVNQYAYDWFTLYPQQAWASSYYTPVPSVLLGTTAYTTINYFYNANTTPITVLYTNLFGSGSFNVPANGGAEYPMPTNSGASFVSAGGENFTVLTTAFADPTNTPTAGQDTAFNWGYTPLPKSSLTTVANVGWAPGSSDFTANGSPVWVTPVANTLLYVSYGGTNLPLTDSAGNKYSTNFSLVALQSKKIFNPSTNNSQTGMKVYTLDGTLLSVAWGEDAATAPQGNPGLDLGTSVLPFPVPLLKKTSLIVTDAPPSGLSVGDTIQYSVETDNKSLLPLGNTVIIDTPSGSLQYVPNSTSLNGFAIPDTTNGFPLAPPNGYTIPIILSQGASTFQYLAQVVGAGGVSNTVNIGGTAIVATNSLPAGYGAPAPAVSVFKSLVSPASGTAVLGQTVAFNLQVIDSGNTVLPNFSLADIFPTNNLSYVSASVPATATNLVNGILTWTNLGNFSPGQETNITVYFTAIKTNAVITNSATAISTNGLGGGATNTGSVTFTIAGVPTAGITVSKSLLSPVGGQAGVGSTVQYNLQVVNSGTLTLTNVQLVDNYPATNFSFVAASVLPNTNAAGKLTWTNIGTFAPGAFTNLTVTFTVTNYSAHLTNFMVAGPPGVVTATNGVPLAMTPGAFTITKTVLSPSGGGSINIGSNIVFRVLVQNTGQIPIRLIPLNDTYSASFLQYLSATIPPSSTGSGNLYWTNLVGAAPLAVGGFITNDITMQVIGGPAAALNTVSSSYAVDTNGTAVAPASGAVAANINAAQITGTVWNDPNHSGIYTAGDTPLQNVTLSLYSVSNGAPVALIESVQSDANGNYSLANLSPGAYLVAESLLPGYAGSAPPNNSVLVNFTSLFSTNINFFQYAISPTNLAAASGTVWNDPYGSGIYAANDTGIANVEVDLLQDLNGSGVISPADPLVQSVFTGTNGAYSLGGIVPGSYILREIVLSNYVNTGTAPLPRTLGSGAVTNGNDFFNFFIGITGTNSPPTAVPDFAVTVANLAATILPLTNDYSPGNLPIIITNAAATNGTASIIGGTNILFTPAPNFIGTATIGYTITNANGSSTSLITVTVLPSADLGIGKFAPASVFAVSNLVYTISVTNFGPASASGVIITDALPNNVTFISASGGGTTNSGIATWNVGTLGSNQVTNVTLTVSAPASGSITNIASVGSPTPDVNPTNNVTPPVFTSVTPLADLAIAKIAPASVNVTSNFNYTISVTNLGPSSASSVVVTDTLPVGITFVSASANGTNFSGSVVWNLGTMTASQATNLTLTVTAPANGVSLTNTASVASPTGDTNVLNNVTPPVVTAVMPQADVSIVKTGPAGALFGTNYNYTISVSNAGPSTAAGLIVTDSLPAGLVFVSSVPATTTNLLNQVIWNLGNFSANFSSNLTLTVISTSRGSLTNLASLGSPTLDPVPTNNAAPPVVTSVTNFPPLANPDSYSIVENSTNTFSPLANDVLQTPGGALQIIFVSSTNGTAIISGTNIIFTPTQNFLGTATIGYTITDGIGGTNSSVISVLVTNIPPLANPDSYSAGENSGTNILSPLANDVLQTPGGALQIISVSPTNGTAVISGTNVLFAPATNFLGTATIGYTIIDGIGGTNSSLISVAVTNRPPVAVNDFASTPKNVAVTVAVLANDYDPDFNPLTIVAVAPTNGFAVISGTNVVFTPTNNFLGTAVVGYTITDGNGGTNSALIFVTVTNRPPIAVNDSASTIENVSVSVPVLANDSDPDGDALTIISVSPTNGVAGISGTNVFFTPATNFLGMATFGYGITDNFGGTNFAIVTVLVTNLPPLANPDIVSITENTTNIFTPLTNDIVRTPGGTLQIIGATTTNGFVTILGGTNLTFIPGTNFLGTNIVNYTVTDGIGGTNSAFITVIVTNIPPIANPDNYSIVENTTDTFSPLLNDVLQTPGGTLQIISVSPANGTAVISGTNIIFTPTQNFLGLTTIGYTITDNVGGTNSSVISVLVTNIPPVANPDIVSITENTTNTFNPLTNDVLRTSGGTLTIVGISPTSGTATISGINIIFTPTQNFLGMATVGYTITDGIGGTNSSLISVLVTNIPPLANPDSYSMAENTTNTLTPLVNDIVRTSGGSLTIISVSPTNGTATILNGTNVVFIPTAGFVGLANIGYAITDNIGGTNSSVISVNVTNQMPVAFPQTLSTTENTALPVTLTGSDPAGGALTFIITGSAAHGTLTGLNTNTGAVTYTPTNNFTGTDTFTFRVNNGFNNSSNATISVAVTPVADLLVQQSGPASAVAGSNIVFTVAVTNLGPASATNIVVTNQIDSGWTFVSASGGGGTNGNFVTWIIPVLPANGKTNLTVTLFAVEGGAFTNLASGISATPDLNPANNNGSLASAQVVTTVSALADVAVLKTGAANVLAGGTANYLITATNAGPSTASNVVVFDQLPAGATLQGASGNYSVSNNFIVWDAATLSGGTATNFTVALTAPANGGTLTNLAFSTSPTPDSNTNNNNGTSSNSIVRTSVTPVADLAIGKSGAASGVLNSNFNYTISVTNFGPSSAANYFVTDSLPNGIIFVSSVPSTTTNSSNQVIWNLGALAANGTTNLSLTVKAVTRAVFTNIATVGGPTLDPTPTNNTSVPVVTGITNRPPVAVNDFASTARQVPVTIPVLANDSDPDGDTLTIVSVSPTNGIAVISGTNIVFTPTNTAPGTDVFSYTITDGNGGTNSALVIVTVTNRPPIAVNDSASTARQVAVTIPVLANDSDPDGDALTIISVSPTNGIAVISGTNIIFTPTNAAPGTDVFGYTITDGFGGTNSALVTVNVTNRPPVAVNDSASTARQVAVTIPVLANDSDPDGDTLTIISVSPTNGIAVISGTNIIFTPTNAAPGTDVIGYRISDGFGGTNSALVFVSVTNRPPVAVNDSASTPKNVAVTIPVLTNDSDPDGDKLTIVSVSPTNGTANISGTNVVFTPATNFIGTATIGYAITDGFGGTNSAIIFVTVTNRPPVANGQSVVTTFNTAKTITLTGSDPDNDPITFAIVSSPGGGILSGLNTNTGAVTYTPTNNFSGVDTFTFVVNDGTVNSAAATVTITVGNPVLADLAVFKTGPTNAVAGTNLIYTITVTNLGPGNATNVLLQDDLPAGFTFVSATPTNAALTGGIVGWPAFNLAAHTKTNFTVTALSMEGGVFTNFATATSDAFDTNAVNNNGTSTNSQVRTTIAALADVQVYKVGGTNAPAGGVINYTITATNAGPSTASNVVVQDQLPAGATFQSAGGSYTISSNVVSWAAMTLTNGASVNFSIALTAPLSGAFTNIALATSSTPDPNPTNNNGSNAKSRVATKVVPAADLVVFVFGPTNAVLGSNFVYSLIVSNAGPSVSSNAVASDALPAQFNFISASSGGKITNGIVTWPLVKALAVGATTNYTITVNSPLLGTFTNSGSAIASTFDPNPTNNTGVLPSAQVLTKISYAQFAWLAGAPVFNPQTGLYEETVAITNTGTGTVAGFQLYVNVLTPNVYLWNAIGTNNGTPYVQYSFPLDPSNSVSMILEFYDVNRIAFSNTLSVVPIIPANNPAAATNGSVAVNTVFTDTRSGATRFVIEFASVPGKTYTIIYSDDLVTWKVATPSVTANANVTQWYDDGPPKTDAEPASVGSRFYRIIKNN